MIGRVGSVVRDLRGDGKRAFAELLDGQISAAAAASELIASCLRNAGDPAAAKSRLEELEHHGDALRARLVRELAVRIVTPLDREDLFRVSRSVDDVLDNLRDFQREHTLFSPASSDMFVPLLEAVSAAVNELRVAVRALSTAQADVGRLTVAARKSANRVRRLYDAALGELFEAQLSMETLKRRELLRRLDVIGLRLREAADALADAAVKRSA